MTSHTALNASLNPGTAKIALYELDANRQIGEKLWFCNHFMPDGSFPIFRGISYIAIPALAEGYEETMEGLAPRPKFAVNDHHRVFSNILQGRSIAGAKLTRILVYADHLDNGTDPHNESSRATIYTVENMISGKWGGSITWQLVAPHDIQDRLYPRQTITRKKFPGCGRPSLR